MKKLFLYMTMLMAAMTLTTGCSSSDDDTDSEDNRLKFANALTRNSLSTAWEGNNTAFYKELGNWVNKGSEYVVMQFNRSAITATNGTGVVLIFANDYKNRFEDKSNFRWSFDNDQLMISYENPEWDGMHAEYRTNELKIESNQFYGYWYIRTDKRYQFNYKPSTFSDWSRY